jgi:4Fe-4S ferredoxin
MCSGVCPAGALDLSVGSVSIKEIEAYPSLITSAEIDEDKCLFCKKCEEACPRGSITIDRTLPNRADLVTGEIEVCEDDCIYCGACAELCPAEAIVVDKTTGEESIVIDKEKCVYCLVCKKACPVDAIKAVCRSCSYGEYDLDPAKAAITGNAIIDSETCIKCGWCEGVCPADAATVKQAFKGTLEIDEEACGTCGACIDVCPCNVLSFPKSTGPGDRGTHLVKEEDYCIHCGACAKVCPNGALTVTRTDIDYTPTSSKSWIAAFEALKN